MFLEEDSVKEEDINNSTIIHAGSCSLSASPSAESTVKAMRLGHEKGKLVSFDVNYRNVMWNDNQDACFAKVREVLPYVDLLKVSDEEVDLMGGEKSLPALMKEFQITVVAETLGGAGAKCFFGGEVLKVAGKKVHCVDTNGAGDAFWGALPSGCTENHRYYHSNFEPGPQVRQCGGSRLCPKERFHSCPACQGADRKLLGGG